MTPEQIVRNALGTENIISVIVEDGIDSEGVPISRVAIVFRTGRQADLDVRAMLDLPIDLRDAFGKDASTGFPIISYFDASEAPTLHAAE